MGAIAAAVERRADSRTAQDGTELTKLGLWDTAGQEDYDKLRPLSFVAAAARVANAGTDALRCSGLLFSPFLLHEHRYPGTDVFCLCFSVVNPTSLQNIMLKWWPEVTHHSHESVPIILVGTKVDLREDRKTLESLALRNVSPVPKAKGDQMAKRIGAKAYLECSALTRTGLAPVFELAVALGNGEYAPKKKTCILL